MKSRLPLVVAIALLQSACSRSPATDDPGFDERVGPFRMRDQFEGVSSARFITSVDVRYRPPSSPRVHIR